MQPVNSLNHDAGWEAVLVEVIESEEKGAAQPLEYWLEKHPAYADGLKSFFADRAAFDGLLTRPPLLPAGETVRYFGDYEILGEIARGGMGVIYRARQINLNREVALKMILGGRFSNPSDLERFRHEAQAVSQLDHPGIVPLYEIGEHQGHHYFTMKLIAGGSVAARLVERPLPPPAVAVRLIASVARAVHYAHQRGILHRDLKPANILLESASTFTPLVADFGLSKPLDGSPSPTHTGAILGTPTYMAPEQARAEKQLTTGVDVYSLGAILYELLTGQAPLRGASVAETLEWLEHREPASPRAIQPHNQKIDRDLETITLKCLAKNPAARYGSAEALAEDLDRWQRGAPILARPIGMAEQVIKWTRRKPAIAALTAALVASTVFGVAGMAWLLQKAQRSEYEASRRADAEALERARALEAEKAAEVERDRAEQSLYFNRVGAAYRYLQDGNLIKAEELLRGSPEKFRDWEWQRLRKLMNPEESSIAGFAFQLTRDGKRMFVFHDHATAVWDVPTWKEQKRIAHGGERFAHSPDGSRYALFSSRATESGTRRAIHVGIFDTQTGKPVWDQPNLPIMAENVRTVAFSPDNRLIAICGTQPFCAQGGDAGSTSVVVDGQTGAIKYTLKQGGLHAAFSPDGKTLAAFEESMDWDRSHRRQGVAAVSDVDDTTPFAWHWPAGQNLKFGDTLIRRDCWIHLVDAATGQSQGKLRNADGFGVAQNFLWSPDGQSIYALQRSQTEVYEVATRKHKTNLKGHKDSATAIAFTPDPNIVLTGGLDHTIKLWNVKEGKSTREWKGHHHYVTSVALIDNGRTLISASGDHTVRRWPFSQNPGMVDRPSLDDGASHPFAIGQVSHGENGIFHWSLAFSADGSQSLVFDETPSPLNTLFALMNLSVATQTLRIALIDTKTQATIKQFPTKWESSGISQRGMTLAFSPDERFAAACFHDQPAILDLRSGEEHFLPHGSGSTMAFSPDGKTLATIHRIPEMPHHPAQPVKGIAPYRKSPTADVARNPAPVADVPPPPIPAQPQGPGVADSLSSETIELAASGTVHFFDVATRKETGSLPLEPFSGEGLSYSPDGQWLAIWGRAAQNLVSYAPKHTAEIRLIDLKTRKLVHRLEGSALNHRDATFSPDGKRITAASWDGNVYVWETASGKLVHTLRGHQGYVWSSCFTPNGKRIISSGNDELLKVWDVATGEEIVSLINEGGNFHLSFDKKGCLAGVGDCCLRNWLTAVTVTHP